VRPWRAINGRRLRRLTSPTAPDRAGFFRRETSSLARYGVISAVTAVVFHLDLFQPGPLGVSVASGAAACVAMVAADCPTGGARC